MLCLDTCPATGTSPPTRRDNRARISPSCGRGIDQSQSQVNLDQVVVLVVDAQQDDFVDLDGDSLVGVTQADLNALAATEIHIDRTPCAALIGELSGVWLAWGRRRELGALGTGAFAVAQRRG